VITKIGLGLPGEGDGPRPDLSQLFDEFGGIRPFPHWADRFSALNLALREFANP